MKLQQAVPPIFPGNPEVVHGASNYHELVTLQGEVRFAPSIHYSAKSYSSVFQLERGQARPAEPGLQGKEKWGAQTSGAMRLPLEGHTKLLVPLIFSRKRDEAPTPCTNLAGDLSSSYIGARPGKITGRKKVSMMLFQERLSLQGKETMTSGTWWPLEPRGLGSCSRTFWRPVARESHHKHSPREPGIRKAVALPGSTQDPQLQSSYKSSPIGYTTTGQSCALWGRGSSVGEGGAAGVSGKFRKGPGRTQPKHLLTIHDCPLMPRVDVQTLSRAAPHTYRGICGRRSWARNTGQGSPEF